MTAGVGSGECRRWRWWRFLKTLLSGSKDCRNGGVGVRPCPLCSWLLWRPLPPYFVIPKYSSSRALVSVVAALFLLSGGLRTLASSGIFLRLARALLKFTVALGRFPNRRKYGRLSAPYFLPFENDGSWLFFCCSRMAKWLLLLFCHSNPTQNPRRLLQCLILLRKTKTDDASFRWSLVEGGQGDCGEAVVGG